MTKHIIEPVTVVNNCFSPSTTLDQLKIVVIERHKGTGKIGVGIVKGFGLKSGAIATTIAHDSHNIIVSGINDKDIITAIEVIKNMQGGMVVIHDGEVLSSIPLNIAGLMSEECAEVVYTNLVEVNKSLQVLGATTMFNPFLMMSFLSLPVIPNVKMTTDGLFDVTNFKHIPVGLSNICPKIPS
ncbi:adenine deaminase C-terminal domain-containing protein [Bacillus clarus]|uniref:adenine deaminase C-terminal domain-containing protein n=1 Tax=Bacillus clarus TaxID=2338372 RepID=UPI00216AC968|nr:adenine deaminase C-terminal domain-containing protein [Bacillus clarus]